MHEGAVFYFGELQNCSGETECGTCANSSLKEARFISTSGTHLRREYLILQGVNLTQIILNKIVNRASLGTRSRGFASYQ